MQKQLSEQLILNVLNVPQEPAIGYRLFFIQTLLEELPRNQLEISASTESQASRRRRKVLAGVIEYIKIRRTSLFTVNANAYSLSLTWIKIYYVAHSWNFIELLLKHGARWLHAVIVVFFVFGISMYWVCLCASINSFSSGKGIIVAAPSPKPISRWRIFLFQVAQLRSWPSQYISQSFLQ